LPAVLTGSRSCVLFSLEGNALIRRCKSRSYPRRKIEGGRQVIRRLNIRLFADDDSSRADTSVRVRLGELEKDLVYAVIFLLQSAFGFFCPGPAINYDRLAAWIRRIHRIIADIRIQVDLIVIPDRIDLVEPPEPRVIDAGLVVEQAELAEPHLAGVLEPSPVGRAGVAPVVVGVDRRHPGAAVAGGDDAALVVGVEEPGGRAVHAALVDEVGLVDARPEVIAAEHGAGGVIFRGEPVAVVEEPRRAGRRGELIQAAERVVGEGARHPARGRRDQPVLGVIAVGPAGGRVGGQIAVAVIGERLAGDGGVLVEAVDIVELLLGRLGDDVSVVAPGADGDLGGGIVGESMPIQDSRVRDSYV
jgi:hypothetical protein